MTDNEDIVLSSQPFEPGTNMKKRKINHQQPSNTVPASFEDELKRLDADMDVDIKGFCSTLQIHIRDKKDLYLSFSVENTEATWGRGPAPSLDPLKDNLGKKQDQLRI